MKDIVPYNEALALKELGFDGDCFAIWSGFDEINFSTTDKVRLYSSEFRINDTQSAVFYINDFKSQSRRVAAPTFSQAFRWFREKYGLYVSINIHADNMWSVIIKSMTNNSTHTSGSVVDLINKGYSTFKSYEEAELACLQQLIKIVKDEKLTHTTNR